MNGNDRHEITDRYEDLLRGSAPEDLISLAETLEAGYHLVRAPQTLRRWRPGEEQAVLFPLRRETAPGEQQLAGVRALPSIPSPDASVGRTSGWLRMRRLVPATLVLAVILLGLSLTIAASQILNLGKPTNSVSTNPYFPLSGFHRVRVNLHSQGKPELLFLGAYGGYDPISIERWPLVKALTQFGTLTGVTATKPDCYTPSVGPGAGHQQCRIPTFDLSHAHFKSRYLSFVSKDLIQPVGNKLVVFQRLSPTEMRIFDRYARTKQTPRCIKYDAHGNPVKSGNILVTYPCRDFVNYVGASINGSDNRTLPLLTVGRYLQTRSQILNTADFSVTIELTPPSSSFPAYGYQASLTFDQVQGALAKGIDPAGGSRLVEDVNAEANIITALICHADGKQPRSVCGRSVIAQILKKLH